MVKSELHTVARRPTMPLAIPNSTSSRLMKNCWSRFVTDGLARAKWNRPTTSCHLPFLLTTKSSIPLVALDYTKCMAAHGNTKKMCHGSIKITMMYRPTFWHHLMTIIPGFAKPSSRCIPRRITVTCSIIWLWNASRISRTTQT